MLPPRPDLSPQAQKKESPVNSLKKNLLLLPAALPALFGLLLCLPNLFGFEAFPCRTSGCRIYSENVTTWALGALGFLAIGTSFAVPFLRNYVLRPLCALALLADACLLALLTVTGPCLQCMAVGFMFFLSFVLAGIVVHNPSILRKAIGFLWLIPFATTCGLAINETFGAPWAIAGDPQSADTVVYFSPSNAECQVVKAAEDAHGTVFCPVIEKPGDAERIAGIQRALRGGTKISEAIESQTSAEASSLMHLRLMCNAAHVARSGSRTLPYIENRNVARMLSYQKSLEELRKEVLKDVAKPKPRRGYIPNSRLY